MKQQAQDNYSIGDLAELGGVNRRTVRYYVQRGLLPPPLGMGRGKHYTKSHLEQLIRVRECQRAGMSLDAIGQFLNNLKEEGEEPLRISVPHIGPPPSPEKWSPPAFFPRTVWTRIRLGDGVELHLRQPPFSLDPSKLHRIREAVRSLLE